MTEKDDVFAPPQAAEAAIGGSCTCNPTTFVVHESGAYCGDPQFEWMVERVLMAMQGDNFVSVADAKRIGDVELEAAEAIVKEIRSWATHSEPEPYGYGLSVEEETTQ